MPSNIKLDLITSLAATCARSIKHIDRHLSAHGISYTELMVLHCLDAAPNRSMRRVDLAEAVGLTASGVTRLLLPLEKMHVVERESNPRDARVSLIKLTRAGETLYKDALTTFQFCVDALTEKLNDKQVAGLRDLLALLN